MRKAKLLIKGRVQGVFYRVSTRDKAADLGLAGWVRNLPDGSVEACALGDQNIIEALVEWCKVGPPHAAVTSVEVEWIENDEDFFGTFEIRYHLQGILRSQ